DADQPGAAPPRRRGRDHPEVRGDHRPLRAARLLPLLAPPLRLRSAPDRAHGAPRLRGPLRPPDHPPLADRLPAPLLPEPVQARLPARRAEGRLGRLALAARRLAHAERRLRRRLARRGGVDPGDGTSRGTRTRPRGERPPAAGEATARRRDVAPDARDVALAPRLTVRLPAAASPA